MVFPLETGIAINVEGIGVDKAFNFLIIFLNSYSVFKK